MSATASVASPASGGPGSSQALPKVEYAPPPLPPRLPPSGRGRISSRLLAREVRRAVPRWCKRKPRALQRWRSSVRLRRVSPPRPPRQRRQASRFFRVRDLTRADCRWLRGLGRIDEGDCRWGDARRWPQVFVAIHSQGEHISRRSGCGARPRGEAAESCSAGRPSHGDRQTSARSRRFADRYRNGGLDVAAVVATPPVVAPAAPAKSAVSKSAPPKPVVTPPTVSEGIPDFSSMMGGDATGATSPAAGFDLAAAFGAAALESSAPTEAAVPPRRPR